MLPATQNQNMIVMFLLMPGSKQLIEMINLPRCVTENNSKQGLNASPLSYIVTCILLLDKKPLQI